MIIYEKSTDRIIFERWTEGIVFEVEIYGFILWRSGFGGGVDVYC
jgi:hypothetical protein